MRVRASGLLCGCLAASALSAQGAALTLSQNDGRVDTNGPGGTAEVADQGDYACRIGEYFAPGGACYVMPFLLPTLPAGQSFATADLRSQLFGETGTPVNADLYGVRVATSDQPLPSDYYQGLADTSSTLIQSSYLTPLSPLRTDANTGPFIDTNTAGDVALVSYLNSAYAGGANAGKYVFLRVSYDAPIIPGGDSSYTLLTANAGGANEPPLLSYTAASGSVPEPVSLAGVVMGAAAFLGRRRRI